ncbi:doublecortin domain-containing protein 2B isoform X2 [Ambystoma mexicanum]|uniref:doublecortin domain-containing protein 2B isoform X2 n=1 Tax=Ambystoma mexicanum TaxID=8296 RepID=UPI0037E87F7D
MASSITDLAPQAKRILVFRNGDPFHGGRRLVVNKRQFLTFEAFLNEVTSNIQASTAVRNIYTPRQGHRVTELGQLQSGNPYVAAGFEKFKGIDYLHTGRKPPGEYRSKGAAEGGIATHRRLNVSARWKKNIHMTYVIHVFRNGDLLSPPFRLLLSKRILDEWDLVLGLLTEKASLLSGAVRKLCTLDGVPISGANELTNGEYYVAVGAEKYKSLPYMELLLPRRGALLNHPENRRSFQKDGFTKNYSVSQDGVSDSALISPPKQLVSRRVQSTGDADIDKNPMSPPPVHRQPQRNKGPEDSIFYAKPVRVRTNAKTNPDLYPSEEDNQEAKRVFRVKEARWETAGAMEVMEDDHTRVELPLDQRTAETIEEESTSRTTVAAPNKRTTEIIKEEATPRRKAPAPKQRAAESIEAEATRRRNGAEESIAEEATMTRKGAAEPMEAEATPRRRNGAEESIAEEATMKRRGAAEPMEAEATPRRRKGAEETFEVEGTPRRKAVAPNQAADFIEDEQAPKKKPAPPNKTPRKTQEQREPRTSQLEAPKDTKGIKAGDKKALHETKAKGKRRGSRDIEEEMDPDIEEDDDQGTSHDVKKERDPNIEADGDHKVSNDAANDDDDDDGADGQGASNEVEEEGG